MRWIGLVAAVLYIGTVWAANYAVKKWGIVSVGFGLEAPAGVYFVGIAFTLRDVVHRALGRSVVIACIVIGAVFSYWVEANVSIPGGKVSLAVASGIAFLVSETVDLSVYEPMRDRGWIPAVVASNVAGIFADSALFLWLAFGSLSFFWGQVVGKAWMTLLALPLLFLIRRAPIWRTSTA